MNKLLRTAIISDLSDEIGRLTKRESRLEEEIDDKNGKMNQTQDEIDILKDALNLVLKTEDDK